MNKEGAQIYILHMRPLLYSYATAWKTTFVV